MGIRELIKRTVVLLVLTSILVTPILSARPAAAADTSIDLSPCKFDVGLADAKRQVDAKCGVFQVPEDRSHPEGRKLDIHFVVLPASNPEAKGLPVFHFEGGPGGAAIRDFGLVWYGPYRQLRENHDIVIIDQRGTGESASLQCTEVTGPALDELAKPLDDAESAKLAVQRMQACLARLSATNDPAFYTSTVLADDTDAIRAALGYDQIDVFGNSYGTWLGQIYLRRYGQHVHAMVLDSVVGPWNNYVLAASSNAETALNKVFDLCVADAMCNATYPDLPGQLQKALDRLDKKPATTSAMGILTGKFYTVAMTRSRLLESLRQMLYQSVNFSLIPQAISQAAQGNYTLTASTLVAFNEQAADLSVGLYYSVQCSETAAFLSLDAGQHQKHGQFFATDSDAEDLLAVCKTWRSAELDKADVAPVRSDRPVLILSGALDPITPVDFANETHERLSRSTLAVFPYQGHGPMAGNKCAQNLVARFFAAPDRPLDTSCTAKDVKPIFLGAFKADLAPFSDPGGKFRANVPKGWQVDTQTSDGPMTFLSSPDGTQLLGIGIFRGKNVKQAQQAAIDLIGQAYGPVELQFTESILFITVAQGSLDRPDEANTGIMMIRPLGADTMIVWQSAPNNVFQAALLPIAPLVFGSVVVQ